MLDNIYGDRDPETNNGTTALCLFLTNFNYEWMIYMDWWMICYRHIFSSMSISHLTCLHNVKTENIRCAIDKNDVLRIESLLIIGMINQERQELTELIR